MEQPNILLVTADSIRADWCGFLNTEFETTPFLSRLASNSYVFNNAIAPGPRTPSSVPVFFTGEFYRPDGLYRDTSSGHQRLIRIARHIQRFQTIPEILQERGYSTVAFTANPWTTTTTNFDDPFDEFSEIGSGYGDNNSEKEGGADRTFLERLYDQFVDIKHKSNSFSQWPAFYQDIIKTASQLSEPWFLWVFLLDTHSPYITPSKYRFESSTVRQYYSAARYNMSVLWSNEGTGARQSLPTHVERLARESYRDSIRSVDGFVKSIYNDLNNFSPSLIFHADHGEAFGEHGTYGHHNQLYEENIRVPLLINSGDVSREISEPISLRSLPQFIKSISATGEISPSEHRNPIVQSHTEFGKGVCYYSGDWKYIRTDESQELYNLRESSSESKDVKKEFPNVNSIFSQLHNEAQLNRKERQIIYDATRSLSNQDIDHML